MEKCCHCCAFGMALFTFSKVRSFRCSSSLSRLLSSLQRPVASLHQTVEEDLRSTPAITQFKNPGATSCGVVRLPADLRKAIHKIIADKSPAVLLREAHKLKNHLDNKKPPLDQQEINNIKAECEERFNREKPPPGNQIISLLVIGFQLIKKFTDTTYMTQGDVDRIKNSRNNVIKKISEQNTYKWKPVVYDKSTALTYLVARLAPDYASITHIFNEILHRDPSFQPATMFDFGSGLGTGVWCVLLF